MPKQRSDNEQVESVVLECTNKGLVLSVGATSILVTWKATGGFITFLERVISKRKRLLRAKIALGRAGRFKELKAEAQADIDHTEEWLSKSKYRFYQERVNSAG